MAGHRPFRELTKPLRDNPETNAIIEAGRRAIQDTLALGKLREERGVTQQALAGVLATSQSNISQIEARWGEADIYLSTLRDYLAALGGRIEIMAIFDDETIRLTPPVTEAAMAISG